MENHYCSDLTNWVQTNSSSDNSFMCPWPWQLPSDHSSSSTAFELSGFSPWSAPIQEPFNGFSSFREPADDNQKAAPVSNSHSQAEKRRRERINAQLGTLRNMIPKSDKMDKAALLGSVIDHVKELKLKAMEVSRATTLPTELDEVTVDLENSDDISGIIKDKETIFIRASVCCDDRPEVFSELIRALKGLRLSIVRADITSVGGRVKSILILCHNKDCKEGGGGGGRDGGGGGAVSLAAVKKSLNLVLGRISSYAMPSNYRVRSKRQRFFLPSQ